MKYEELTGKIIGHAMKVHTALGCGFQELIYQRALEIEMKFDLLEFEREYEMPIYYKKNHIGTRRVYFLVSEILAVELKAVTNLEPVHFTQAINYLEAYNLELGILINFGSKSLQFHRFKNLKYKPIPKQVHPNENTSSNNIEK